MKRLHLVTSCTFDSACAACFAYEALAGKPLLRVSCDLEDYNGKLASLHMAPMAGAPVSLRNALQAMLAQSAALRPPAISFAAAGYFQVRLRLQTTAKQLPGTSRCGFACRPQRDSCWALSAVSSLADQSQAAPCMWLKLWPCPCRCLRCCR